MVANRLKEFKWVYLYIYLISFVLSISLAFCWEKVRMKFG